MSTSATRAAHPVRRARKAKGLTQVDLAVKAGVTPATVHRIEAGRHQPHKQTALAIAAALEARAIDLFPHPLEFTTDSEGCGPTREADMLAGDAASPIHKGV